MEYDLAIVGGGPAGSTCLRALAGLGLRVVLIEKATFPREKACGDAVPGLALQVWEKLDPALLPRLLALPSALPLSAGFVAAPGNTTCRVQFAKPGLMVRRAELDAALLEHAQTATPCTIINATVTTLTKLQDGFALSLSTGATLTARRLAAADGATGPCRTALLGTTWQPHEVSVAVRAYVPHPTYTGVAASSLALWFHKSVQPGYIWAFPLADGTLNVGAGVLGQVAKSKQLPLKNLLSDWLCGADAPRQPMGQPDSKSWLGQKLPLGKAGRVVSGQGFCLLGDAGGLIAPATGDGIGQAALSGVLAAKALADSLLVPFNTTDTFLHAQYHKPLYAKLGASFTAQRRLLTLVRWAPYALDILLAAAARVPALRKALSSL